MLVSPTPPTVKDELKHIGNGLRLLENPTQFLSDMRAAHGDTFLVDAFGYQLFCTFSAKGLESLYQLPEADASFGLATYDLIGFKTPTEVFLDTDTRIFYDLLTVKRVNRYLEDIADIADLEIARMGESGEFDAFDHIRTLEQRLGYRLWIGEEASSDAYWLRLKSSFDVLDQEKAFVDPASVLETIKTNKKRERAAVAALRVEIDNIWAARVASGVQRDDTLQFLHARFADEADPVARCRKVAHNVMNANQGFLSNLYAAMAWCIVHIVQDDALKARAVQEIEQIKARHGEDCYTNPDALNEMVFIEQLMMESVRVAQRSITLRKVVKPIHFDDGERDYALQPGVYVTTLLSVTNSQAADLAAFDPDHYEKNRLSKRVNIPGKETVSTFGHGKHACPAQRFSHMVNKIVLSKLLSAMELEAQFDEALPSKVQLGGVARSENPCPIAYTLRA